MNKLTYIIIVFILAGCSPKDETTGLEIPKDYKTWGKPVDIVMDYEIPGHGKTFRVIYANSTAFSPQRVKSSSGAERILYKEGSIFIKEVYEKREDIDKNEPVLTVMKKESKNKMALNGWVYCVKKPGKNPVVITTRMCVGCHESANELHPYFDKNSEGLFRDYIFVPVNN